MIRSMDFVRPGKVVSFMGKHYRILLVNPEIVILIEVGIDKYHFETVDFDYFITTEPEKLYEVEDTYFKIPIAVSANELDKAYLRNRWIGRC